MYVHTETASLHYSEAREVRHTLVLVGWTKHHLSPCQLHAFAHTIASTSTNEEIAERKSSLYSRGAGWMHHFFQISVYPR